MKKIILTGAFIVSILCNACTQTPANKPGNQETKHVGGECEGCEAIFENSVPFLKLSWIDTMPDFKEEGPKLEIAGTVYKSDGRTPAPGVIVYAYHTDQTGRYPKRGNETGWGKRHGYIRGWVRTNEQGQYRFITNRPAAYPGRTDPAHIHFTVKELDKNEYWIDDIVFDDDPLLTADKRKLQERGGSGIVVLGNRNGRLYGERNIYLGKNIPDYTR